MLGTQVRAAANSRERRSGLLSAFNLPEGSGLWINPSEAIHTFGMQMAIDVVFLDRQYRVRKLLAGLRPGRIGVCFSAYSVLELPAGTIRTTKTAVGDTLAISRVRDQVAA